MEQKLEHTASEQGTDSKLKDRKLKIKVTPTLVWKGTNPNNIEATIAYEQKKDGTEPDMDGAVDASGDINISKMPKNDKYTNNIDITLVLDTSELRGPDGKKLSGNDVARWAYANEGDYTYNGESGTTGYGWFCQMNTNPPPKYARIPPISIPDMTFTRVDDKTLEIDDNTADGSPEYGFCFAFVLPQYGNYYIGIDPIITTKGLDTGNFMLKD